jgi:DNA-binding GntR family transcriptional regulator
VTLLAEGELAELFDVRGTLELAALAVAVRLGGPEDLAAARSAHERLQQAVADKDEREYHHQSRAFHVALTRPSAMPRLLAVFDRIWDLTEPYRPMEDLEPAEAANLHAEHDAMLDAFAAGDAEALLETAAAHQVNLTARVRSRQFPAQPAAAPVRRTRYRTLGGRDTGGTGSTAEDER